jgi:endoribonuclease Nob1
VKTLGNPEHRRVIVLDTSAFVAGLDPFSTREDQYTVPAVRDEIPEDSVMGFKFKTAEENGKIKIENPTEENMEKAKKSALEVGDSFFLSETDLQLLALAIELRERGLSPLIATDDYSIQNVAKQMGIEFASLVTFGIRRCLEWLRYCPACHKAYPSEYKSSNCEVCGTALKRKPLRRNPSEHF